MKVFVKALLLAAAIVSSAASLSTASAQSYPSRPVRIYIGSSGGATDAINRLFAAELGKRLNQSFIVDNRPGANNSIAARVVKNSAPDGYNLFGGAAFPFSSVHMKDNPMDAAKEFQPISTMALGETFLMVRGDLGVKTFKDFVAKAKTTTLKMASASPDTHAIMTVVGKSLGFQHQYIPYKETTQAIAALLSGDCDFTVNALTGAQSLIDSGKFVVVATTASTRSTLMPNIPTLKENGANIGVVVDFSLWAPLGTPRDVVDKIGSTVAAAVKDPTIVEKSRALGLNPKSSTPEELTTLYNSIIESLRLANEAAGIQPE